LSEAYSQSIIHPDAASVTSQSIPRTPKPYLLMVYVPPPRRLTRRGSLHVTYPSRRYSTKPT